MLAEIRRAIRQVLEGWLLVGSRTSGVPVCLLSTSGLQTKAFSSSVPTLPELGAADTGSKGSLSGKVYEAYCGDKKDIDCNISFEDGRMKVDG